MEVLATLRSGASQGALEGGRMRVTKDMASALRSHYGLEPQGQTVGAERVDLDVLEFPKVAGTVDITEYLTPSEREQYLNVDRLALEPHLWEELPRPCQRAEAGDEDRLHRSLLEARMAGLASEEMLLSGRNGKHRSQTNLRDRG